MTTKEQILTNLSTPPSTIQPIRDGIPEEVRALPQWICWLWQVREGKWTKLPIDPKTGGNAKINDPAYWATFDQALAYHQQHPDITAGVGFVFTEGDPYCGIDFDGVLEPSTGVLAPWVKDTVERLDSYTEQSVTGTGLHIIVKHRLAKNHHGKAVELYDRGRYFALTGYPARDPQGPIREVDPTFLIEPAPSATVVTSRASGAASILSDDDVLVKAQWASNHEKFNRLWAGDCSGYASPSEADAALCCLLAFWCRRDTTQIDRLFRQSKLFRPKWDEKHSGDGSTYGEMTIRNACTQCKEVYTLPVQGDERFVNAYNHVTSGRYTGPTGADKEEHNHIARIVVIYYGFNSRGEEALVLMRAYNDTHGRWSDARLQEALDLAESVGGVRGAMWPRKPYDDPHRLAVDTVNKKYWSQGVATLRLFQDEWYTWDGTKYVKRNIEPEITSAVQTAYDEYQLKWRRIEAEPRPEADLSALDRVESVLSTRGAIFADSQVLLALAHAREQDKTRYGALRELIKKAENITDVEKALPPLPKRTRRPDAEPVTPGKIKAVLQHLATIPECQVNELADGMIAFQNGVLDLSTRVLKPHTPRYFSTVCLPFAYDPQAPAPSRWLAFLGSLWGEDQESIDTVQDWFGLVLARDTSLQKILLMVGPPRSGKGTIGRTLTALLGPENVAGPTLAQFSSNFGLSTLVGKPLAIIPDARLDGRTSAAVIERLLSISGEDALDVDRKYLPPLVGTRLRTLLMILTNETPKFQDESGAIANRFVVLQLTESFLGKEDTGLTKALEQELPGIFNWAMEGLARVRTRGRLCQPNSAAAAVQDLRCTGSKIQAFAEAVGLHAGDGMAVSKQELFEKWTNWCMQNNLRAGDPRVFGRDLRTVFPQVRDGKGATSDGKRVNCYLGIGLACPECPDGSILSGQPLLPRVA